MTEENKLKLTDKQKKLTAAAIIGTLILGSGAVALTNREKEDHSQEPPKVSKVSRVKETTPKKEKKKRTSKKEDSDAADDVFSTYGLEYPETRPSSEKGSNSTLSPSEIKTMATILGNDRKRNKTPQVIQRVLPDPIPKTNMVTKNKNSNQSNNPTKKPPVINEKPEGPAVIVVPDPPVVTPPTVVATTPSIEVARSEVVVQEGQDFDLKSYFTVRDSGDPAPTVSFSQTHLTPGRNEIQIYATNKFGKKASATLTVFLNQAPIITAKEKSVNVSIHTTPDLKTFVTAEDPEDGSLSDKVEITGLPDTEVEGTYSVVYNVSDSKGGSAKPVTVEINVVNEAPEIHAVDREISVAEESIDLLEGITVTDKEDDRDGFPIELSAENILEGEVDLTTEGEYLIKVGNVKDRDGKAAEDVEFTVKVTNLAPEVSVPVLKLKVGEHFDPIAYKNSIVFSDIEDNKAGITPTLEITQSDLDAVSTTQAGEYSVTIKVTDSSGKSTTITGLINVVE